MVLVAVFFAASPRRCVMAVAAGGYPEHTPPNPLPAPSWKPPLGPRHKPSKNTIFRNAHLQCPSSGLLPASKFFSKPFWLCCRTSFQIPGHQPTFVCQAATRQSETAHLKQKKLRTHPAFIPQPPAELHLIYTLWERNSRKTEPGTKNK